MDNSHAFDFPLADLDAARHAALDAALDREHIEHQWVGTTLSVDIAYEGRVSTLVDQARTGALPPAPADRVLPAPAPTRPGAAPPLASPTPYPPPAMPGYAVAPGAPPAPAGYGAPAYATTGYGAPTGYVATPRTNGMAIASLILGIASLITCLGLVLGIPAVVCGHLAKNQIRDADGLQGGEGLATAGLITGWIANGLSAAGILFWIVVVVVAR